MKKAREGLAIVEMLFIESSICYDAEAGEKMKKSNASSNTDRRQFLRVFIPAGTMCCLGSSGLSGFAQKMVKKPDDKMDAEMHKSFYIGAQHSAASIIYFTFKKLIDNYGDKGRTQAEEITWEWGKYYGMIIREEVEKAVWKYYNPEWKVEREKRFTKHGVCRLTWRKA